MTDRAPAVAADPAAPLFFRFRSNIGDHVLIVPYSCVFDIPSDAGDFISLHLEAALPHRRLAKHRSKPLPSPTRKAFP